MRIHLTRFDEFSQIVIDFLDTPWNYDPFSLVELDKINNDSYTKYSDQ